MKNFLLFTFKLLNVEILKINEQILECYQNFDNALFGLHQRKVKTQQAIFQVKCFIRKYNSLLTIYRTKIFLTLILFCLL